MIIITKSQRDKLKERCAAINERLTCNQILVAAVDPHMKTAFGIWMKQSKAKGNLAQTPTYCGIVLDAPAMDKTVQPMINPHDIKKGDLVRFSPLTAEGIELAEMPEVETVLVDPMYVKTVSHSIYNDDESLFLDDSEVEGYVVPIIKTDSTVN